MKLLNSAESVKCHNFVTNFLARIFVNNEWPWNILWFNEAHFTLEGAIKRQNFRIWVSVRSLLCMSVIRIQIKFVYGMVLQLNLFLVLFSLRRTLLKIPRSVPSRVHVIAISFNRTSFPLYVNDSVFMQDGAPPIFSGQVAALLRAHFGYECVISRNFSRNGFLVLPT